MKYLLLTLAVFSAVFFRCFASDKKDDPRKLSIYQIMVASFRHSPEGANGYNALWGPDDNTKNGNLKGITEAIPHIKSLGVNAIWLTPVFDSTSASGGEKLQATGYFTNNYFRIDPNFGTEEDFIELVNTAHENGLYVFLDGVFGHHGGVTEPSPKGNTLDVTVTTCDRKDGGTGNIKYPGSLEYIKEVATHYIEKYGIDGWRLDQAYQAMQGGHNYWKEIRKAVEDAAAARKKKGEKWGTLGYMVGEDWGDARRINDGVYKNGGLLSAFDFEGKELISGPMQEIEGEGLVNGWKDVEKILSDPKARGYLNNKVMPNLFLSNHDGYRVADHFDVTDPCFYEKLMTRNAILAAYSGPITLYYGDEYADQSKMLHGGQKDNIARTSGHLEARTPGEQRLKDYISYIMGMRAANPAMWRGKASFEYPEINNADVLVVYKKDPESRNKVAVVFSDADTEVSLKGVESPVKVSAYVPQIIRIEE